MKLLTPLLLLCTALFFSGCATGSGPAKSDFSHFVGMDKFSKFSSSTNENGELVLLSPIIPAKIEWNQLIVSWNADAPAGTFVKIEAVAIADGKQTKFYTMGKWSLDGKIFPRTSVSGQRDADGTVDADTLILNQPANAAQFRITLGGTNGTVSALKFLGASFSNTKVPVVVRPPNHEAWGKIITTPEHSQHGYP